MKALRHTTLDNIIKQKRNKFVKSLARQSHSFQAFVLTEYLAVLFAQCFL